jgi:AcrR family transcriptional regulator
LRLFADRGPDAVTVREIAANAGVSAALVLHHFGSKDGLRAEVDGFAAQAFDAIFEAMPSGIGATVSIRHVVPMPVNE